MKNFKKINAYFLMGFALMLAFSSCKKEQVVQQAWQQNITPITELPEGADYTSFETQEEANAFLEQAYKEIQALGNTTIELNDDAGKDAPPNLDVPCDDYPEVMDNDEIQQYFVIVENSNIVVPDYSLTAISKVYTGFDYPNFFSDEIPDHSILVGLADSWAAWDVDQGITTINLIGTSYCKRKIEYTIPVTFKITINVKGEYVEFTINKIIEANATVLNFS